MIGFVFRWLFPAVGSVVVAISLIGAPQRGEPPLASLWGGRAEAVVRSGAIVAEAEAWPRTEIHVA